MIVINRMQGQLVVGGPADVIEAAAFGSKELVITGTKCTGDRVYLAPRTALWSGIARTMTHPEHGAIAYAYVDMARLDGAPTLRADMSAATARLHEQDRRIAASIPACDNCGDCALCL
jgi:hypothetical protein